MSKSASTPIGDTVPPLDLGASPELAGTNRSGKKRRLPKADEDSSRRNKTRKMVVRTPNKDSKPPSPGRASRKSPNRDEDMSTSDLASIMREGMSQMLGGMNKFECEIMGKIDNVREDLRKANANVSSLEEKFRANSDENNLRFERFELALAVQAQPVQSDPCHWPTIVPSSQSGVEGPNSSIAYATALSHAVSSGSSGSSSAAAARAGRTASRKEINYWKARKSLFLWPVIGPNLKEAAIKYVQDNLEFEEGDILPSDIEVERVHTSRSKKKSEAWVKFKSVEQRDSVRASAYLLADKDAGMKIDVPDSLCANFRHLDSMCFTLKKKFPSLKRAIKYDDDLLDLYADIQTCPGGVWKRLDPGTARVASGGDVLPASLGPQVLTPASIEELLENDNQSR